MNNEVIDLGLGQIGLGNPGPSGRYGCAEGDIELREAIAHYEAEPLEKIRITTGASGGLLATLATLPKGASVLCPRPYYPGYPFLFEQLCLQPRYYDLEPDLGWLPTVEGIRRAATDDTGALLLNYPSNPVGRVPSESALRDIANLATSRRWLTVVDEVYRPFVYDNACSPKMSGLVDDELLVRVNSFSKAFQIPGERVGYTISGTKMARIICQAHWRLLMSTATSSQRIALDSIGSAEESLACLRAALVSNRRVALAILSGCAGIEYIVPEGGLFFWIGLLDHDLSADLVAAFCERTAGVRIVPGTACGWNKSPYLRVSFAALSRQVEVGFERLGEVFHALGRIRR